MDIYSQLDLIKQKEELGKVDEVCKLYNDAIRNLKQDDIDDFLGEVYALFAEFLFTNQEYEQSVDMFVNAYNKNYMPDAIKQILYSAFIDCNKTFLQSCYEKNVLALANGDQLLEKYGVDSLPLDFFGTNGVYQIFSQDTNKFVEKIKVDAVDESKNFKVKDSFSDFAIYVNYKFYPVRSLLYYAKTKNRSVYIVVDDIKCFLSCLKTDDFSQELENIYVFSTLEQFREFFAENANISLPHNVFSTSQNSMDELNGCINDIHKKRITTPQNRQNVLLTIGIPSYNRGHRALQAIEHLSGCIYDSEVEFLVSNNDSKENTQGYQKIKDMAKDDCRIKYYDVEPNYGKPGFFRNFKNVLNKANGKYCLFVSDEDLVILENLHIYLSLMRDNTDTALIIASGTGTLGCRDKDAHFVKGAQAQARGFLDSNYISGSIYNKHLFVKAQAQKWLDEKNTGTNLTFNLYPQMFLDVFILQYGDLIKCKEPLIVVDEDLGEKTSLKYSERVPGINEYSVYDSRLVQHKDWCELAKEMAGDDIELLIEFNQRIIGKTVPLINIVKDDQIAAGIDWDVVTKETVETVMQCFDLYLKDALADGKGYNLTELEFTKADLKAQVIDLLVTGRHSD